MKRHEHGVRSDALGDFNLNPRSAWALVKVLSEAECTKAWETAGPDGDTLSKDKATPYVLNFQMVDTDKDGKISAAEFKTGCGKGWVQSADASTTKDMIPPPTL